MQACTGLHSDAPSGPEEGGSAAFGSHRARCAAGWPEGTAKYSSFNGPLHQRPLMSQSPMTKSACTRTAIHILSLSLSPLPSHASTPYTRLLLKLPFEAKHWMKVLRFEDESGFHAAGLRNRSKAIKAGEKRRQHTTQIIENYPQLVQMRVTGRQFFPWRRQANKHIVKSL